MSTPRTDREKLVGDETGRGWGQASMRRSSSGGTWKRSSEPGATPDADMLRGLVGAVGDWIWRTNEDHCFVEVTPINHNPAQGALSTGGGQARAGSPHWAPDSFEWWDRLSMLERHEPFRDSRYARLTSDGRPQRISVSGIPLFDAIGHFKGYMGVASEIECEVVSPNPDQHLDNWLVVIIDAMDQAVAIWDGSDALHVCNRRFQEVWSATGATKPGISYADHLRIIAGAGLVPAASDREDEWCAWRLQLHRGDCESLEMTLSDGRWMRVRERVLPDGRVLTVTTDITEPKRTEARLRATKTEVERSKAARSEFLSLLSHELRTPMNAVVGFIQLLEHSPSEGLTDTQRRYISRIATSGGHLAGLIDQLFDLAKAENEKKPVEPVPLNVAPVVADTLFMLSENAADAGVTLYNELEGNHPPKLLVDEVYFRQILLNLVSNAIKYNARGGSVRIQWSRRFGDRVRLVVADTGLGIPEDKRAALFKPFERLGRGTGMVPGTGIGLALTKRLTRAMRGDCGVVPGPDGGSNFWVSFPIAPEVLATEEEAPRVDDPTKAVSSGYILVMEDIRANHELLRRVLECRRRERVIEVTSAGEGIAAARMNTPSVILMDLQLPDSHGFEAMRRLKADPVLRDVPVVAVSRDDGADTRNRARELGFAAFIANPAREGALSKALDQLTSDTASVVD